MSVLPSGLDKHRGDCWHNNHHAYPGSARLGLADDEWDPGWWLLVALRRCGLVWNLRLPADLPARPELVALKRERRICRCRQLITAALSR